MSVRVVSIAAAFLSLFLFPYPLSLILSCVAGLFFPPAPFLVGVVGDLLYYHPSVSFIPYGVVWGSVLTVFVFFVRRFLRNHILSV